MNYWKTPYIYIHQQFSPLFVTRSHFLNVFALFRVNATWRKCPGAIIRAWKRGTVYGIHTTVYCQPYSVHCTTYVMPLYIECKTTRTMSMVVRKVDLLIKMLFVFVSSLSTENLLEVDNLPHVGHLVPHSLKYNNLFLGKNKHSHWYGHCLYSTVFHYMLLKTVHKSNNIKPYH